VTEKCLLYKPQSAPKKESKNVSQPDQQLRISHQPFFFMDRRQQLFLNVNYGKRAVINMDS